MEDTSCPYDRYLQRQAAARAKAIEESVALIGKPVIVAAEDRVYFGVLASFDYKRGICVLKTTYVVAGVSAAEAERYAATGETPNNAGPVPYKVPERLPNLVEVKKVHVHDCKALYKCSTAMARAWRRYDREIKQVFKRSCAAAKAEDAK